MMDVVKLRSSVDRYLALRRSLGFAMRSEERRLRSFVAFLATRSPEGPIRAATALEWACSTPGCGPSGRAQRLSAVRGFLVYLHAHVPETEVPGPRLLRGAPRAIPFIYTKSQIRLLMDVASQLGPPGSLRPYTVATLIGLLASTGLRAGEALRLDRNDVRLLESPPHLVVRLTKFRKSRLVPVHASAAEALQSYAAKRKRMGYDRSSEAFFVSERHGRLAHGTVRHVFVSLARSAGLKPVGQSTPRLHGLRHSFAVRRLLAWYKAGVDVGERIPNLSVYLGHVRPRETFWYLTGTPELLRLAAERFEACGHARGRS
jgi:integrase